MVISSYQPFATYPSALQGRVSDVLSVNSPYWVAEAYLFRLTGLTAARWDISLSNDFSGFSGFTKYVKAPSSLPCAAADDILPSLNQQEAAHVTMVVGTALISSS